MRRISTLLVLLAAPGVAMAHHFMGGATPQTVTQGLLSGLGHPIIGADHAAFIVGAGCLLGLLKDGYWGVLALIAGSLGGAALHLAGLTLPGSEIAIAISVVAIGALLVFRQSGRWIWVVIALAGVLHGYAYAESIFGAQAGALGAYLLGFSFIQFAIATGAFIAQRKLPKAHGLSPALGLAVAVVGAVFFYSQLLT